jgi:ABC-type bacteriocin/lantibiotic exporter with double-glycine peptidase domain
VPAVWLNTLKSGLAHTAASDRIGDGRPPGGLRTMLRRFYPTLRRHGPLAVAGGALILLATLAGFAPPLLTRYLVDDVILGRQMGLLAVAVLLLAACLAAEKLLRLAEDYCFARFEQRMLREIQEELLARALALPKAFFDDQQTGYLTRRFTEDVEGLRFIFSGVFFNAAGQALRLAGGVFFLIYLEWRIALLVLSLLPGLALILRYFSGKIHLLSRRRLEQKAEAAGRVQESLAAAPVVKAFAAEERTRAKIMSAVDRQLEVSLEQSLIGSLSGMLIQSIPGIGRAVALAAGAVLVIRGEWSLGSLLAFQAYLVSVFGPAQFLSAVNLDLQRARAALERVSALFDLVPEEPEAGGLVVQRLAGEIELRGVSFAYGAGEPVLENLSFRIRPGEAVAIMGPSGIGKTTLLSLLLGFYRPSRGEIYIDGKPAREYDLTSLRRRLGYLPQDPRLLSGTILENLRLGNPAAGEEDVHAAAAAAGIHDAIAALPQGYAARVGEGGFRLSAGERQRLALARALVVDPDILILDEPTASLDEASEQTVMDSLERWRRCRTVIVVTHRPAAARFCDRVVNLENDRPLPHAGCNRLETPAQQRHAAKLTTNG